MRRIKLINYAKGPEDIIQTDIIKMLKDKGWYVKSTHGNAYQSGFPDLYAAHRRYGARWIEVKNPLKYCFTPAQNENFPMMNAAGVKIYILTGATEMEYAKLFGPENWHQFLACVR